MTPTIRNQDATYRRGLVLGLTMAEIMVLILFILLLALSAAITSRENKIDERDRKITGLLVLEDQVRELTKKNPSGITVADIIQQLSRQKESISELREEIARLEPFEGQGEILEDIIREIERTGIDKPTPESIIAKIKEAIAMKKEIAAREKDARNLIKENDNLRGQVAQMSRRIKASGRGNEFPSCWTTKDGKTQSIFEIVIGSGGVAVYDRNLPDRVEDKKLLPLAGIRLGSELTLREFRKQIAPLYRWSVKKSCRFYVIRFSSKGTVRTDLVNAVDAFFYPFSRIRVGSRRRQE